MMFWITVLLLTLERHISTSLIKKSPITYLLQNPNEHYDFTHLIANDSKTVIVGGTNYIHVVFTGNLSIKVSKKIGPELDNPNCIYLQNKDCIKSMYNSYIKVLLINKQRQPKEDVLIICTTLFHGSCRKRSASTLELLPGSGQRSGHPVVANNSTASTVAFLAPGPKNSTAMYVGASWTNTGSRPIRSLVPTFSSRNTVDFDFTTYLLAQKSYTMVDQTYVDSFPIRYIYGFELEYFSYIATIQKQTLKADNYVSKLIRVCQFDKFFYSYAETSLSCVYSGKSYNLLQTAHLSKAGRYLAKELGIPENERALFAMFGYGNPYDPKNRVKESVLCIFPYNYIKKVFTRNTQKCFQGIGKTGPDHLVLPNNCLSTNLDIGENYCGQYEFNHPIDGPEPISSTGVISLDITASSLMLTTTQKGHTVAFVGTSSGKIKKIKIQTSSIVKEYDELSIDTGIPITKYIFNVDDQNALYVLTSRKLIKMDVETCKHKALCDECVEDPFCGWNSLSNMCDTFKSSSGTLASTSQCPRIANMTKTRSNKTGIAILGIDNLSMLKGNYTCRYSGYGTEIMTDFKRIGNDNVHCIMPQMETLPSIINQKGCIRMKISILFEKRPMLSKSIDFFDCELEVTNSSCLGENCTVDGFWSSFGVFGEWSSCNQTCGGGHKNRTRYRSCTDPPPSEGGEVCQGSPLDREIQQCNTQECPVYGTWTSFEEILDWSQCSQSCGRGTQRRVKIRTCIPSKIENETEICNGSAKVQYTRSCSSNQCPSDDNGTMKILAFVGGPVLLMLCVFSIACICYRRRSIERIVHNQSLAPQDQKLPLEDEEPSRSHYNYITDMKRDNEDDLEVYNEIVELDELDYLTPINAANSSNSENTDTNGTPLLGHNGYSSDKYYMLNAVRHDNPYRDLNHLLTDGTPNNLTSNENNTSEEVQ
ncbi:plexin-A4-like [Saccostrea cucullata]|uniref:plexin-A4-like n=1 Tax=Saccostrea cuccullata TaxID=36930 RepID=UPI002ED5A3F0